MVSACIIFDVAIYPLMIWFLFIDVPDFLKQLGRANDMKRHEMTKVALFLCWDVSSTLLDAFVAEVSIGTGGREHGYVDQISGVELRRWRGKHQWRPVYQRWRLRPCVALPSSCACIKWSCSIYSGSIVRECVACLQRFSMFRKKKPTWKGLRNSFCPGEAISPSKTVPTGPSSTEGDEWRQEDLHGSVRSPALQPEMLHEEVGPGS